QSISPSSANFTSTPGNTGPTVPKCRPLGKKLFTAITGDVSVSPYPSKMGILAAKNTLARRGCNAAPPDTTTVRLPPTASCHLLNTSLRAIDNLKSYHQPLACRCSYLKPKLSAQKKSCFLIPVSLLPVAIILSNIFSSTRGTATKILGFTSFKLSPIVSILSA